jgi:DNA-binding transcriptional LysR family regulator
MQTTHAMETRELRYFVAVAEELHFARAAARVGIEQSPLSKAITEMERHLGVRLFVRTRRSTRLTYAGESLLPEARRILAQIDEAHRAIIAAAAGRKGRLRVAICNGLAHPRLASLLALSRCEDPDVDIKITHSALPVQLSNLSSGMLDLVFSQSQCDDRQIRSVPLWKDAVALVMRADNPLASQQDDRHLAATATPLILLGDGLSPQLESLNEWLLSLEQCSRPMEYVMSMELLLTLVAAGYGVGVVSIPQAEMIHRSDLVVRPLNCCGLIITTFLVALREEPSEVVTRFIERALGMKY